MSGGEGAIRYWPNMRRANVVNSNRTVAEGYARVRRRDGKMKVKTAKVRLVRITAFVCLLPEVPTRYLAKRQKMTQDITVNPARRLSRLANQPEGTTPQTILDRYLRAW